MQPDSDKPSLIAADSEYESSLQACPVCGTTLSDLYVDGRMGCEECYRIFADVARQALFTIHGTSRHTGKRL